MKNIPDEKIPFDIDVVMVLVREAVTAYPPAALFQLSDEGFRSPFEQLVACVISIRTMDEQTLITGRKLFEQARTPEAMLELSVDEIDKLIHNSSYHENKAGQIREIAERVVNEFEGKLPCDEEVLRSFRGVGVKCANLTLAIGCNMPKISVDVHVHQITNRWGYVETKSPETTTRALENKLPEKYWVEINRLLVPFGKHICTGHLPHCSVCPVLKYCRQVGVINHR